MVASVARTPWSVSLPVRKNWSQEGPALHGLLQHLAEPLLEAQREQHVPERPVAPDRLQKREEHAAEQVLGGEREEGVPAPVRVLGDEQRGRLERRRGRGDVSRDVPRGALRGERD